MKRMIKVFLAMSLLLLSQNSVDADELENEYSDDELRIIHYIEEKEPLFNIEDGEIVAICQYTEKLENESTQQMFMIGDANAPMGSIGSDYMTMSIAVQRISHPSYDDFKFTVVADWLQAPAIRGEDALAIAWSDDFSQYNHICKAYYNSYGYISGKTDQIDSTPEVGVCYAVDCSYYYGQALDYATLSVWAKKYDDTGTAVVSAKYGHNKSIFRLSVSYNGDNPSISFSPAISTDTMAKDKSFNY